MRSATVVIVAVSIWWSVVWIRTTSFAADVEQQVCDVRADYFLGVENYSEAIRLHVEVVRRHPDDALAHYHLGFALGMVGQTMGEIREYQRAEALGLKTWDFFLNLGLAQIETGDLEGATSSLRRSRILGADHPESHFSLALVDERRGMLNDAEHEISAALTLDPVEPDERNLLGVIYAEKEEIVAAYSVWSQLVHDAPDYEPARKNLVSLRSQHEIALCDTNGRSTLTPIGSAEGIRAEHERHCAKGE